MDINDLKNQINDRFENTPIQSSAFYADPEDHLDNQKKLRLTLKSFIETQKPDTPFALQLMATHSEITIMPLGLLDLNELKEWENKKRAESGKTYATGDEKEGTPIVVQFDPHVKEYKLEKQILDIYTDDLFEHFHDAFNDKLWPVVMKYLNTNQTILRDIEKKLVEESQEVKETNLTQLKNMTDEQMEKKLGYKLSEEQFDHYATYIADLAQVNSILVSSGEFVKGQLLKDMPFPQMMNLDEVRNTFFWVLDNTFNEIIYFYIQAFGSTNANLKKHLNTIRKNLATLMRTDAWKKCNDIIEKNEKFNVAKFFNDVFLPIAENLEVEVDKFK
ncbi:hypothetical protein [Companilactobacillus mishanensis]|uniref:Uncharacterized protein n=1 Tax=Companilactobacillus mishanensis TaxID=2486008 RepID=A0ABW9PAA6_9LACO|nr:hypothetical protein [Companilactobacillus mishanensis]MQS45907.1 hypothetical protein [Companilactobacillus mishanensis]MQS89973.1 hypothetical protein [Companilactobacillus mishanensis]